ncbi:hypothetical protein Adu01nite_29620 [Paractinoplanes durhamensis]|uniref:Uncharacterized protein n=1 Tax=Paractinoplanes durhamensis TaxID=113563 RepID=A0ABQ3YVQ4_9ACTN|nr:hypothetical protein Adu01nite_29620 [Actinoplanes durhamensis]
MAAASVTATGSPASCTITVTGLPARPGGIFVIFEPAGTGEKPLRATGAAVALDEPPTTVRAVIRMPTPAT